MPETVGLQVGKKVDWKDYVTVKINGEKSKSRNNLKLTSGNENAEGYADTRLSSYIMDKRIRATAW